MGKSVGVFGCAYSISNTVQVSRTRQAPNLKAFHQRSAAFFRTTLSTNSDEQKLTDSPPPVSTIGVLGAGTMGHGIAQVAAAADYHVVLSDVNEAAVTRGLESIQRNLEKGIQRGKVTEAERAQVIGRIQT